MLISSVGRPHHSLFTTHQPVVQSPHEAAVEGPGCGRLLVTSKNLQQAAPRVEYYYCITAGESRPR